MAQVDQQVSATTLNGLSENGSNGAHALTIEPMDLSGPYEDDGKTDDNHYKMSNGVPKGGSYASSSADHDPMQLSPASLRRRSTRASALKAQEKIKYKDDGSQETNEQEDEEMEEMEPEHDFPTVKKRKLNDGASMDQFSHRFGIRIDNDDVYALTDESELSSLHESELDVIRGHHEKYLSKELTDEQKLERLRMIKQCESDLRLEEARLAMLKKIKSSQTMAKQKLEETRKLTMNLPSLNSATAGAYKPAIAQPTQKLNAAATANANNKGASAARPHPIAALASFTPQQLTELSNKLGAMKGVGNQQQAALIALIAQLQQQQQANAAQKEQQLKEQQSNANATAAASAAAAAAAVAANNVVSQAKSLAAQTPQQRIAAARIAFRAQADKQLMGLAGPKTPGHDLFFAPSANVMEFSTLLGLDLVVQRVLKDKEVHRKVSEPCYVCEECKTDFTTSWKAIGSTPDELHLYCENCVRTAQKRKIRNDHTALLKKGFTRIANQEKEFEKQLADGKLDAALAAQAEQQAQAAQAAQAAVRQQSGSFLAPGGLAMTSGMMPSTSSPSSSGNMRANSSSMTHSVSTSSLPPNAAQQQQQQHKMAGHHAQMPSTSKPSTPSTPQAKKNNTTANANIQQLQQQLMMQQLNLNPMLATMARNSPNILQQMMQVYANPAIAAAMSAQQRLQNNMQGNPNMAAMMAMMAQAAQQNNAQGAAQLQQQQQLAVFAAMMGNNMMNMNPAMARLLQQMNNSQQRNSSDGLKNKK